MEMSGLVEPGMGTRSLAPTFSAVRAHVMPRAFHEDSVPSTRNPRFICHAEDTTEPRDTHASRRHISGRSNAALALHGTADGHLSHHRDTDFRIFVIVVDFDEGT